VSARACVSFDASECCDWRRFRSPAEESGVDAVMMDLRDPDQCAVRMPRVDQFDWRKPLPPLRRHPANSPLASTAAGAENGAAGPPHGSNVVGLTRHFSIDLDGEIGSLLGGQEK
jgi:hypothetical protein